MRPENVDGPAPDDVRRAQRRRAWIACAAAASLGGVVYLNALHNPFVYDDFRTVVSNATIVSLSNIHAIVLHDIARPLVNVSYAVDHALWGAGPMGFHATSVLLHMLNVVLLFQIGRRVAGDSVLPAFAAAALFAVHPLMTEAVGYISGRSEVLCAAWFLAALLSGQRWLREGGGRWMLLTIGFWTAALATKESGAMLPFVLLAYDWFLVPGSSGDWRRRLRTVHLPLIGIAVAAGIVRVGLLRIEYAGVSIHWSYALIAFDVVGRYVALIVNPMNQTMFHEVAGFSSILEPRAVVAVGVVAAMVALALAIRRRNGVAGFGIAWFLLVLVPSSALIVFDQGEPMTEHRVYLASAGLFLTVGAAVGRLDAWALRGDGWRRRLAPAVLAATILSFGLETIVRNGVWRSPVTLWRESVALAPTHFRPRLLLGEALQEAGRRHEAIEQYRTAIMLRPEDRTGYVKLGQCLVEIGRLNDAAAAFERLRGLDPRSAPAANGLGTVAVLSGRTQEAHQLFIDAIEMDPRNVPARRSIAMLAEFEMNPAEALRRCEEIQRLAPGTTGIDDCVRRNRASLSNASK